MDHVWEDDEVIEQWKVASIQTNYEDGVATAILASPMRSLPVHLLQAKDHVLVDSHGFAFLYMLEAEEMYHVLRFEEDTWAQLKDAYEKEMSLYVQLDKETILQLTGLNEEMAFLLENISGNSNYGADFEQAVRCIFFQETT